MKKVFMITFLIMELLIISGCQNVTGGAVIIEAEVAEYLNSAEDAFGELEKEVGSRYWEIRDNLKFNVEDCKDFAVKAKDELLSKTQELAKKASELEVKGSDQLKNLHSDLSGLLKKQEDFLKKLIAAIESGAQDEFELAQAEYEKIAVQIENHKSTVDKLSK